jgi:hypothetical protein
MPRPRELSAKNAKINTQINKEEWNVCNRDKWLQSMKDAYRKRQEKKKEKANVSDPVCKDLIYT